MSRIALVVALGFVTVGRADEPKLPDFDRTRIAEAFRLADALGNKVWPGWDKAPFAILLITPNHEFLLRHPKLSADFTPIGEDSVLKQKVWRRARKHAINLLATFPAVGGVSTIVVGQAENTDAKTSTPWVVTLLHEHFHQLQSSRPRYYADVEGLGLARGDKSGMWMLNYPFPYGDAKVKERFAEAARALAIAVPRVGGKDGNEKLKAYLTARQKLRESLNDDDWKYFAFQVWQEGVARYTELRVAELAAKEYEPSAEFRALKDFKSYEDVARTIRTGIVNDLAATDLDKAKRTAVYAYGAAEALLLDRIRPAWRERYFDSGFSLDPHFRPMK